MIAVPSLSRPKSGGSDWRSVDAESAQGIVAPPPEFKAVDGMIRSGARKRRRNVDQRRLFLDAFTAMTLW